MTGGPGSTARGEQSSDGPDFRRTVILLEGRTQPGQDMFIRGGLDHQQAEALLGRQCSSSNYDCALPIRHLNLRNAATQGWKTGDDHLDWYGPEPLQQVAADGVAAVGTPADWTTNYWPVAWGAERRVEVDGYGVEPFNRFGMHYWMVDVEMDCSAAFHVGDERWFELKSYISNGPGWEPDVHQPGTPYPSINHLAQCGMLNVFRYGEGEAHFLPLSLSDDPFIVGAADVAYSNDGKERTAQLLDMLAPSAAAIFVAGDNIQGTPKNEWEAAQEFQEWFAPTWGRHKDKIRPAPGNHDFKVAYGKAYFDYYGPVAGDASQGYYSYDVGDRWHVVVLNSNNAYISGRWPAELDWLRQDLEAHRGRHVFAYWHQPRFSSGEHGNNATFRAYWDILAQYHADVIVNGHDHHYERFARQSSDGQRDDANGIRQFIVGTGGMNMRKIPSQAANSEVRQTGTWGVLKMTLHESWYEWVFIPAAGGSFVDTGSTFCHPVL